MTSSRLANVVVTAAAVVLFMSCSKKSSGPAAPAGPVRNVIFTENFEDTSEVNANWMQLIYQSGWTTMAVTSDTSHSPTHSLYSIDTLTGMKRPISPSIDDSIAGLEFYLLAKQYEHFNFFGALATTGSSYNGLAVTMGLGISESDSLMWVYRCSPDSVLHEISCAALSLNTWNKCKIEYDFNTSDATFSINDIIVHQANLPAPPSVPWVITDRESLGVPGIRQYYIDDITVYKR